MKHDEPIVKHDAIMNASFDIVSRKQYQYGNPSYEQLKQAYIRKTCGCFKCLVDGVLDRKPND
jgi:hypothetical protein